MIITVVIGDITRAKVDAIVNAANASLLAGGGVCGAIFRACGNPKALQIECNSLAPIKTGQAVITHGYELNAKYIIHAVGPVYQDDKTSEPLLVNTYLNSLILADSKGLASIAFPLISSGIYGYPLDKACKIALETIKNYNATSLKECFIYCIDERAHKALIDKNL